MTTFVIDGEFYDDLSDYLDSQDIYEEEVDSYDDSYLLEAFATELQPLIKLNAGWITERINDERCSEHQSEIELLGNILNNFIDFDKINEEMPKLYYSTREKIHFTKEDLIAALW